MLKFLLTNDDGIDAPGLHALWASVHAALADRPLEVTVVAPDRQRSECGHSVTTGRPLAVCEHRDRWFAVDGTPGRLRASGVGDARARRNRRAFGRQFGRQPRD